MRRQYGIGGTVPAGSGRNMRPDPHSLPVRFEARDGRADGGVRHVEINRERIVVRRAVSGVRMAVNVRISEYLGISVRKTDNAFALILVHRDPSLSVPLFLAETTDEIEQAWLNWSEALALPCLESEDLQGGLSAWPASRRRRHNIIKNRRPRILMRRRTFGSLAFSACHAGEREIIARN